MEKFSIGILSWHSTDVLINTLTSYHNNGLLEYSGDTTIYFQQINDNDKEIANHFKVKCIGTNENIGIGQAFIELAKKAKHDNILLLEHDWELIEPIGTVQQRLITGFDLLGFGYDCIRYRHRTRPGYPHFSIQKYKGRELEYEDPEIKLPYPHLLDSVHWCSDPDIQFAGKIGKQLIGAETYYVSTSRYSNFTNNPCMYRKDFYLGYVKKYVGKGIDLEGKISYDWARANFNVAHGEGLFMHNDPSKYGNQKL